MSAPSVPQKAEKFDLQSYAHPPDLIKIRKTHAPYSGSPHKHPYDREKIILIVDPFVAGSPYYEFSTKDVVYLERLPNLVNLEGRTVSMARVWVKKKSVGVLCTPFLVEEVSVMKP